MAIKEVIEQKLGRKGSMGGDWRRAYTRTFLVNTDDPATGSLEVRLALPVRIGDTYRLAGEFDNGAFCDSIECECRDDDGKGWICAVGYGPWDPALKPQNPLDEIPQIAWQTQKFQAIADADKDGAPITNSAGDYFDPPVEIDDSREILVITRNEAGFDEALADAQRDTINAYPFFGFDPLTVKCANITGVRTQHPDLGFFWVVTYEFEINRDKWTKKVLDQGMRKLDPSDDTKQINMTDSKGAMLSSPALLDGSGQPLTTGDDPQILEFHAYPENDFSVLNLDGFSAYLQNYSPNMVLGGI